MAVKTSAVVLAAGQGKRMNSKVHKQYLLIQDKPVLYYALKAFENLNVLPVGEPGDAFDPQIHNAVMHVDDESLGENVIAEVFQKGYKMGDKVVRHALVKVAN